MHNIKERIKQIRKINNLTQEEFAKKINISRSNIANIESGQVNVTDRVIFDICDEFCVNEIWLRTGSGDMKVEKDDNILIVEWAARLTNAGMKNSLAKQFAVVLSQMDEVELAAIVKFAENIVEASKNRTE